ncbi:MAG TPA: sigma-70 family RNA polymerase sigma factor [Planctomicrobium sp.]|nr:sigma-70 family RNA polymerase sigma factor [Planctomicrobium sp.]
MTQSDSVPDFAWAERIDTARRGDMDVMGEIWNLVWDRLVITAQNRISGVLRVKLDAEDVVQQTLMEAQQSFGQFHGQSEAELLRWLGRLLENNLIDAARRYRRIQQQNALQETPVDAVSLLNNIAGTQISASSVVRRKERDELLLQALKQLSTKQQQLIELRHRRGLSFIEIGKELEMTDVAARKLWSRTIEELQKLLAASHV